MTSLLCFVIVTFSFVKVAMQSSLHNWPMEMSDPVVKLGKSWACRACGERMAGRFSCPVCVARMVCTFATCTWVPLLVNLTFEQMACWDIGR